MLKMASVRMWRSMLGLVPKGPYLHFILTLSTISCHRCTSLSYLMHANDMRLFECVKWLGEGEVQGLPYQVVVWLHAVAANTINSHSYFYDVLCHSHWMLCVKMYPSIALIITRYYRLLDLSILCCSIKLTHRYCILMKEHYPILVRYANCNLSGVCM